ncbi:MAG: YggS family pyridoxal phosphate-dependent enzyme [Coriobacteriia bacterium]|nr:YggS family pyridoxal phosphate-dependent enzyme [Coriobacteriia bacterium]
MNTLAMNFENVRSSLAKAQQRSGRMQEAVTLIAVSKTVSFETVLSAMETGQTVFGENRVPELENKLAHCPGAKFHLIGSLQTNKVKKVVGRVELIHSVDSIHLLAAIDKRAAELGIVQPVLLQINIAEEDSKHGFTARGMKDVCDAISGYENVLVNGLMTMAPHDDAETVRWVFRDLRILRDSLREYADAQGYCTIQLDELSMGMSNDYEVAIEEGATLVRVGTALFKDN